MIVSLSLEKLIRTESGFHPRIFFYGAHIRAFRDVLIGYLYELAQEWPVILASEVFDHETETLLRNKELFPHLRERLLMYTPENKKRNVFTEFKKAAYFCRQARDYMKKYRPDIVIAATDVNCFELYLMRQAKKNKALTVTIQPGIFEKTMKKSSLRVDLENAETKVPRFLPFKLRIFLIKIRKWAGHLLYYWLFPLFLGEKPFWGRSSHILYKGSSGMRDSDYHIVFSPQQYEVFQANGVNSDKLFVYPLPMARHTREFYERINWVYPPQKDSLNKKALVLLSPWEIGVSRDMKIIPNKEFIAKRIKNIRILAEILNQYQIIIKFHPISKDVFKIKKVLESMPFDIKCLELCSNIYEYLAEADVVIELAKGGSTAMYIASLLYPDKFLLSLDMEREFLGDTYRDFEGIVYVDSQEGFIRILESIRDNKFVIPYKGKAKGGIDFSGCTGLFKYLWCQNKALG